MTMLFFETNKWAHLVWFLLNSFSKIAKYPCCRSLVMEMPVLPESKNGDSIATKRTKSKTKINPCWQYVAQWNE